MTVSLYLVEQIIGVSNRALEFRKTQRDLLHGDNHSDHSNCAHAIAAKRQKMLNELKRCGKMTLGDVTSLNITTLQAGMIYICLPEKLVCLN